MNANKLTSCRQKLFLPPMKTLGVLPNGTGNVLEFGLSPNDELVHFPAGTSMIGGRQEDPDGVNHTFQGSFQLPTWVDRDLPIYVRVIFCNGTLTDVGGTAGQQVGWAIKWELFDGTIDGLNTDDTDTIYPPDENPDTDIPDFTLPVGTADGHLYRTEPAVINGRRTLETGAVSGVDFSSRNWMIIRATSDSTLDNVSTTVYLLEVEYSPKFYKGRKPESQPWADSNEGTGL